MVFFILYVGVSLCIIKEVNLLKKLKMERKNFEIENRKVEYGISVEQPGSDLTPEDLAPETDVVLEVKKVIPSCHLSVRKGLPF